MWLGTGRAALHMQLRRCCPTPLLPDLRSNELPNRARVAGNLYRIAQHSHQAWIGILVVVLELQYGVVVQVVGNDGLSRASGVTHAGAALQAKSD